MAKSDQIRDAIIEYTRPQVLAECERAGMPVSKVLLRIAEALDAEKCQQAVYLKDGWVYSKTIPDHKIRLEAAAMAIVILGIKATEKHGVEITGQNLEDAIREARQRRENTSKTLDLRGHKDAAST